MLSVKEEKRNRIVEILVSSVSPIKLLSGKILGITGVGLLQIFIWLSVGILGYNLLPKDLTANAEFSQVFSILHQINLTKYLIIFFIYYIFGYLIYGLLFAAVSAAVDNDSDTQQFTLPITLPLITAMVLIEYWIESPDSQLSFWFSIIPFTSPITMIIRIANGIPEAVPYWQLFLSIGLLVLTFFLVAYVAGKIYRIGILTYGKKITYKELWKWLKF